MKFCPNCGNKINGNPRFCSECGSILGHDEVESDDTDYEGTYRKMTEEDDDDYVPFGEADRYDSTSVDSSYQDQDYTGYYSSPAPEPPVSQPPVIVQVQEKKKQPMIDGIGCTSGCGGCITAFILFMLFVMIMGKGCAI